MCALELELELQLRLNWKKEFSVKYFEKSGKHVWESQMNFQLNTLYSLNKHFDIEIFVKFDFVIILLLHRPYVDFDEPNLILRTFEAL